MENSMKMHLKWLMISIVGACLLTGCDKPAPRPTPDKITVQLKWFHQAQFAGFYLAQENGFYADENLEINFLEGGKNVDTIKAIVSGRADFAVAAPEDILIKQSRKAPIKAIAAVYRRSAVVFLAKADSGIERPFDFVGKTVAIEGLTIGIRDFRIQFDALERKLKLDQTHIKRVAFDPGHKTFQNGAVDITPSFITGGLISMKHAGYKLNVIWPGDYGIHFYSDTLVASERIIANKPEVVIRFLRATLKGWHEAMGDTEAAVAATLKYARIKDASLQKAMMEAQLPLVHTGEDHIGWMKKKQWREMIQILGEQNIISEPLPDVSKVYTMRFLEIVYGGSDK
jgi:NitT/TauT family transport system substrate-binding protein